MVLKRCFYIGLAGLLLFEIAQVYCIMPMPGSQRMDSLDFAYQLHQWRWYARGIFGVLALIGGMQAFQSSRWMAVAAMLITAAVAYMTNFVMAAETMFYQPRTLRMADAQSSTVNQDKLVLGIEINGQAKAYPIQYLGYHHQVRDTVGGAPVMVTYCTVCRSGRVFSPSVNGKPETFRLVGMDHFNAMFEDATTKSWWRQATGEAVAGPLKGAQLPELPASQTGLRAWLALYPNSLIMQPDTIFASDYSDMETYDIGLNRGELTTSDTISWNEKSWIAGIAIDQKSSRAFDWNRLKQERIIQEKVGDTPVVLILADDNKSLFAYQRPDSTTLFSFKNDTLQCGNQTWNLLGKSANPADSNLKSIPVYQEFWHSWRTFHPHTTRY